tara:strand:- start:787 stop:1017 length:231 start_codon:yes stop_codon:yes gene_type:complete
MCAIAASVGLSLFQGLAMRSAATQAAEDTAEIERQGVKSAEDAKRNKQLALAERKQEETVLLDKINLLKDRYISSN